MLYTLMVILYVIVCLFLIAVVLLQTGKRADLAGAFGGGGSQTAFGTRGAATFLSRMTTVFAVLFMLLSLGLSISSSGGGRGSGSVLDKMPSGSSAPAAPTNVPATPQQNQAPQNQAPAPQAPAPQPAPTK